MRCGPVRHQRQRHEPAGQQQLDCDVRLEDRADARRPERDHPEHRQEHRADQVGTPDRDEEDADLEQRRVELRVEREPEPRRSAATAGSPRPSSRRSPRGRRGADGAAEQRRGQLALADPPLPAVRREHDVHVPDQRPDDVVGGELAGRDPLPTGRPAARRSSSRRRGRRPARRPSRSCRSTSPRGTGTRLDLRAAAREVEVDQRAGTRVRLRRSRALLREDELDHVLDRRILDGQVGDVLLGEQPRGDPRPSPASAPAASPGPRRPR